MTRAAVEITRRKATVEVIQRNGVRVVRVTTPGPRGPRGAGVPAGGTLGQVLRRAAGADYSTTWGTLTPGDVGADAAGTAASGVAAHLAASDPHPQYTTPAEAAAAAPVQAVALAAPSGWSTNTSNSGGNVTLTLALPTGTSLVSSGDRVAWDQAATTALRWDGSATGLDAAAGRASLGLGTAAQSAASDFATAAQGALAATAVQPAALSAGLAGKADLVNGAVPAAQLPSYVDDVLEFANVAAFPATGETGKIYVSQATGRIYRWSGSAYIEICASPGSTDAVIEGSINLYFTAGRAAAAAPVQSVAGRTGSITLSAGDISGLATVATSGNYGDLINRPDPVFIQATQPTTAQLAGATRYSWWDTSGGKLTLWIEAG